MESKQIGTIFIALIFGGSFIAYALSYSTPNQNQGRVSRARIQISICDETRELPEIHVKEEPFKFNSTGEGVIQFSGKEISLGKVFDLLNMTFSRTKLMNYTNDNGCPDLPSNEVHLFVKHYGEGRFRISSKFKSYKVQNGDFIRVSYY